MPNETIAAPAQTGTQTNGTTDSAGSSAAANRARIAADRAQRATGSSAANDAQTQTPRTGRTRTQTPPAAGKPGSAARTSGAGKPAGKSTAGKPAATDAKIATAWKNGATIAELVIRHGQTRPQIRRAITRTLPGGRTEFNKLRASTGAGGTRRTAAAPAPVPTKSRARSGSTTRAGAAKK